MFRVRVRVRDIVTDWITVRVLLGFTRFRLWLKFPFGLELRLGLQLRLKFGLGLV